MLMRRLHSYDTASRAERGSNITWMNGRHHYSNIIQSRRDHFPSRVVFSLAGTSCFSIGIFPKILSFLRWLLNHVRTYSFSTPNSWALRLGGVPLPRKHLFQSQSDFSADYGFLLPDSLGIYHGGGTCDDAGNVLLAGACCLFVTCLLL